MTTGQRLSQKQFDDAIKGTKIGRSGKGSGASLQAARLYMVEGASSMAAAAEQFGCHRNTVGLLVRNIASRAQAQAQAKGLELITVEIPRGKRKALAAFVASLSVDDSK
jgi:hypothetical protein